MAQIAIAGAAFTGFRVIREQGWTVLMCAVIATGAFIWDHEAVFLLAGPATAELSRLGVQGMMDPRKLLPIYLEMAPAYLAILPFSLVIGALVNAAMNRVILRPGDRGFGYFQLGMDEVRQAGVMLALWLIFLGGGLGLGFIVGVTAVAAKGALGPVIVLTAIFGGVAALILSVRLSLAPALSFDTRRFNLSGSWALTRRRFWPLLGAYALTGLAALAVLSITIAVLTMLAVLFHLVDAAPHAAMAGITAPAVLGAAGGGLLYPIMQTPSAAIYHQITGGFGPNFEEAVS